MSSKLVFVALAVAAFAANTSADKDYKIARARIEVRTQNTFQVRQRVVILYFC